MAALGELPILGVWSLCLYQREESKSMYSNWQVRGKRCME